MTVESFEIENWEEHRRGLTLAENTDWLLLHNIPVDYVLDGYILYNKKYITKRINGSEERFVERVLSLKQHISLIPESFAFTDTIGFLKWCENKFGIFEFQDEDENALTYGTISKVVGNELIVNFIDAKGIVEENFDYDFEINQIRSISFSSNYFEAIRLLWIDENNLKPTP